MTESLYSERRESLEPNIEIIYSQHKPNDKTFFPDTNSFWPERVSEAILDIDPDVVTLDGSMYPYIHNESEDPTPTGIEYNQIFADGFINPFPEILQNHTLTSDLEFPFNPNGLDIEERKKVLEELSQLLDRHKGRKNIETTNKIITLFAMGVTASGYTLLSEKGDSKRLSRRDFLRAGVIGALGTVLAAVPGYEYLQTERMTSYNANPRKVGEQLAKVTNNEFDDPWLELRNLKLWLSTYDYMQHKYIEDSKPNRGCIVLGSAHAMQKGQMLFHEKNQTEKQYDYAVSRMINYLDIFKEFIESFSYDLTLIEIHEIIEYLKNNFSRYGSRHIKSDGWKGRVLHHEIDVLGEYIDNIFGIGKDGIPSLEKRGSKL